MSQSAFPFPGPLLKGPHLPGKEPQSCFLRRGARISCCRMSLANVGGAPQGGQRKALPSGGPPAAGRKCLDMRCDLISEHSFLVLGFWGTGGRENGRKEEAGDAVGGRMRRAIWLLAMVRTPACGLSDSVLGFYGQALGHACALQQPSEMLQDPLKSNRKKKEETTCILLWNK